MVYLAKRAMMALFFERRIVPLSSIRLHNLMLPTHDRANKVPWTAGGEITPYKFNEWIYTFQNKTGKSFANVSHYLQGSRPK